MNPDTSHTGPYDLAVAYRLYPRISRPVPVCAGDKLTLAEVCLKSFRESLGSLRVKLWALLDGCPPEYEAMTRRYFDAEDLTLVRLDGEGNAATFERQLRILSEQTASPLVYFAEDDYFYLPDALERMVRLIRTHPDVHFVSPYDHPDYYTLPLHDHPAQIIADGRQQWKQAATTCLTFLTTQAALRRTKTVFATYARRNYDTSIWLSLTKYAALNPGVVYRSATGRPSLWKAMAKTWLFGWRQMCFGTRWNLYTPTPTLATHVESAGLAPGVNWVEALSKAVAAIKAKDEG